MVKIPIGRRVIVDLWNTKTKKGMVKHFGSTMDLVRAESEFDLQKEDEAIVIESFENFVRVVPMNKYTEILQGSDISKINYDKFAQLLIDLLQENIQVTGGILSFEDILIRFQDTFLRKIITKKHLKKVVEQKDAPFHTFKEKGIHFIAIKHGNQSDIQTILNYAINHAFITVDMIQMDSTWSDIRIKYILKCLEKDGRIRKENSYRTGTRYYFIQLNG